MPQCDHPVTEWLPITDAYRSDGSEIVVRLKDHHIRMPVQFLGKSVHQIGRWLEGDLWVSNIKVEDDLVYGFLPLPAYSTTSGDRKKSAPRKPSVEPK